MSVSKIGIIGTGNVGGTLGKVLARLGHEVIFGARAPLSPKVQDLLDTIPHGATANTIGAAVQAATVVILATPWEGSQEAIAAAGDMTGKILIDTTNPIALGAGIGQGLLVGHTTSGAEEIAKWAPRAMVVKAFNNIGANNYENPQFGAIAASAFICGDDLHAKQVVAGLAREIGFRPIDVGNLQKARLIEPLAMLWIDLAIFGGLGREFAIAAIER